MHGQMVSTSFGEGFKQTFGLFDHQMHVQRQFGDAAAAFDDHGPHCQVGSEVTIDDINVDPIHTGGFTLGNLFAKAGKVC